MFQVRTFNQISTKGLKLFSQDKYSISANTASPNGILLRSHKLSNEEISANVSIVVRAGAGYNNVPVDWCTSHGIIVLNTPGANANSVKELVLASLLNASRGIVAGQDFVRSLQNTKDAATLHKIVEAKKKLFKGREIAGKTIGIVGLGYIGSQVANAALSLGMEVLGHDPALSVDAAWRIPSTVERIDNLTSVLSRSDYITLHVPLLDNTRQMINADTLKACKSGAVLLNFSRDAIIDPAAVAEALTQNKLSSYFSDFPEPELLGHANAFLTPHLGASTAEAEENCAIMAVRQLCDFLENGNIKNSVNFPEINLERTTPNRFAVINRNVPAMLGQILSVLASYNINVVDMLNKSRGDIAYNLIDTDTRLQDQQFKDITKIEGVIGIRSF